MSCPQISGNLAAATKRPPEDQPARPGGNRPARRLTLAATVLLAGMIVAVFFPVWRYDFIDFDTFTQVVENDYIKAATLANLKHIFTSRCITSYYPVRTLTFLIDHQVWGLRPGGFKLTNLVIHLANVLLVFWLVLRLFDDRRAGGESAGPRPDTAIAALAAGIVAIHPVVVEPVIWIPGREELLMTLGALGTIHFHLTARRRSEAKRTAQVLACHVAAVLCCAAACLSNAVAVVIPALAVACDLLALPRRSVWRTILGTAPLWAVATATMFVKILGHGAGIATAAQLSPVGRLMIGLSAYWLNLKSLIWPDKLALCYNWVDPHGFLDRHVLLGTAAVSLTVAASWAFRKRRLLVFGLAWYVIALLPTLQVLPHHIHRADRFLYLPMVGMALAAAAAMRPLTKVMGTPRAAVAAALVAGSLLVALGAKSTLQVRTWRDTFTVWGHCIDVDPKNARAHDVLADNLAWKGQPAEAAEHYQQGLEIFPDSIETLQHYAQFLALEKGKFRDCKRAVELATRACEITRWMNQERRETLALAYSSLAYDLHQKDEFAQAIVNYQHALEADPDCGLAAFNLALLLATCPDRGLREYQRAVWFAEHAQRTAEPPELNALLILATVYASADRFAAAAAATREAIEIARADGDSQTVADLEEQLRLYQDRARGSMGH